MALSNPFGGSKKLLDEGLGVAADPLALLSEEMDKIGGVPVPPKENLESDPVRDLAESYRQDALRKLSDEELMARIKKRVALKAAEQERQTSLRNMSNEELMARIEARKKPEMGAFEYLRKSAEAKGVVWDGDTPDLKKSFDATVMALTPFFDKVMRYTRSNEIGGYVDIAKGNFNLGDPSIRERYHDSFIPYYNGAATLDDVKKDIQETALRQAIDRSEQLQRAKQEIENRGTTTMGTVFGKGAEIVGQTSEMAVPGGLAGRFLVGAGTEATSRYAEHANGKIGYDKNGNPVILDGDSAGKAAKEALLGGGVQSGVELLGGKVLGKVWGATGGKLIGKAAGTAVGQKVAENSIVKGVGKITKWLKTPLEATGWSGMPGEIGEEFMQGATDAYFGLDTTDAEERGTTAGGRFKEFAGDFFKGENLADLTGSMLLMQAIGGGSAYLQKRHTNKQLNKIITEKIGGVSENVLNKLSPEEKARIIESHYQGLSAEEAANIINKGAGALDKFMIEKQAAATQSADGRAMLAEMNPEAADAIRAARREGKDISRKMIRDLGLSEKVLGDVESRNKFGDALLGDDRKLAAKNAAKMDGQQEMALRQEIAGFVGDTPEAQRVFDRVTMKLKDASVLDDPYQREKLVMQAAEAVYAEDQARRVGGARQKARMSEKADHEARLAGAEAQAAEQAQRAENDAQERTNAEMMAREEKRYDDFMLAREEARAKGGLNEARTDEAPAQPEQAQSVTPPAGEEARPLEAGKAPSEVGGEVKVPKWISDAPPSTSAVGRNGLRIVAFPRNGQSRSSREGDAIVRAMRGLRGVSVKVNAKKSSPEREIFFDKTSGSEFANSGNTKYLRTIARKGTDVEKEWAKKTLSAKVSAIPYFREIIANARNERHTPYEAIKNTPGHEKKKGQWGGGLYEYDVAFAVDGDRYKGRMVVRCDNKGKMFLYDIVDLNDGSAIAKQKVLNEKNRSRASYTSKGETKDSTASMPNIVSNLSSRVNAGAASTPTKPKTVREGKAFVNSNIGKRFTDGKKTYEITGLTKDGEVSVKVTDKIGKSRETTLKLSGTLTNIFGTKKTSAVWSEIKATDSEQKSSNRTKIDAMMADAEPKTAPKSESKEKAKAEVKEAKSEAAPTITPAEAMRKLGTLGAADVDTLTKAMHREERLGHTERANMIRVLRDYKRGVGTNSNPQSDETSGGKYRASVESAKPLDDPAFVAWAKKRGVAPTTQKRDEYDKAMADTLKNRLSRWIKGVTVKTVNFIAPEEGGDVRHSVKQEEYDAWNKVLDDYEGKRFDATKNYPVLSRMPAVLRKIGVNDLPITMYGGILQKITGEIETSTGDYHGIPVSELRKLQIELDNPIAVFDSATRDDSIVVLTRLVDNQNNERAVVALRLDQEGSGSMRINAITSAYGKNKASFEKWVKEKRLLRYVNKEARNKSARWLQLPGDSKFRALNILTEKDFSDEELGRIIPKSDADSNDAAYLDAVKRGDIETAQRMVREAAAKAMPDTKVLDKDGLPLVVYHGTYQHGFTVFKAKDEGIYTSTSKENADGYSFGKHSGIYDLFINAKNPLVVDAEGSKWSGMQFKGIDKFKKTLNTRVISPADLAVYAREHGYDGVVIKNVFDGDVMGDDVIVYQSTQIKSADAVTYDDAGNVIPLSQRFNPENNDIRYLHDGERIVGSYNRVTGEVKLAKGASVETVLHELGWHAARHWAEVNADSDPKAANLLKQMKGYAESAPEDVKKAVRDTYGEMSADTLLDEIGAARFTKEQSGKIAEALATKEGAAWYQKVWNKVVDFYKNFLTKIGYNRVDLDGVEYMSPDVFGDFLADVMMSGKQLGERTAFSMEAPKGLAAKWTNNLSDYKAPIAELEKRTTGSSNNIYYLARTLEGMAQRGKNRAERAIKRVEKILGEDISPELLAQYMQLKAYEERNAKIERRNGKADASGMTPEDARAIEKAINESGVDEAIFEEAAQILWDLQKEGLQARVDAGLLDQETANKWMTDEPHHIPWKDAVDPDSGEYVGCRMGASEFDTAEGRKTAASGDPITWMLQEYQDAMTRAAQNRLRSSIANLTRLNGDVGTIYNGIQTDSKGKRSFIKYPKDGGKAKVLSIPEGVKIESTVKNDGGMKNVLTFKEGGETKYLVLNGSLGEAVAGAVTGRTLSRPPAWISGTMRLYAATATSLSPAFAVRNITADNFDIHNNLVAKYGWVKGEKMFGKVVKEQFLMTKQLGSYIKNGDFKLGKDGNATDFQKLVEAYEDAGGLIGGMATEGYDATVKKIQADFRAGRNKARSIGKSVATYWTMMQRMSELAPRLAVFKSAMESGMSAKEAAMLSRDITVDFNKKGAKTPWFNTLFMFSNSALGANLTQMKGLAGKTGAKLAGGLVMYGFAEGLLEALMNGDDDEREKEGLASGKDINEYTRQNSLYIRRGDKVFRVNIHMGPFAYAKYFGNVMARTFSGMISPEKAAKELGLTAAEVAASFTGLGNVSGDALVQTAVPTIIQPFVQIATNKDYAGRAIKRAKYTESQPYSSHGRKSTPPVYHWMAKRINEFFGGNDYRKGKFLDEDMDIAPETVKVLTEMVGKNFARDIMEIAETGYKLLSGNAKDLDVRNIPFAGDVVRKQDGNDNRYYENYNRYRDDKHELKKQKGWTTDERRAYLKEHPWLYSAGKPGVTRIDNIVKRIEKLRDVEESDRATEERKAEAKATRRKLQTRVIEIMTKK